jgi:uncharacterized protein (TIGR03084 family)
MNTVSAVNGGERDRDRVKTVDPVVAALGDQHAELDRLLAALAEANWQRPTRCEGWTLADVVLHLAQTDELALASSQGRFADTAVRLAGGAPATSIDEGAAAMVERERGQSGPQLRGRWQAGAAALREALAAGDPHRRVVWVAGELSLRTLATTRLAETWIHAGDVADALGVGLAPTDRLRYIARLAWRTLPYAFTRAGRQLAGPVAFQLRGPAGDSWEFRPETDPATTISGGAAELCLVAARRADPTDTSLTGEGPDATAVLELVRTYA